MKIPMPSLVSSTSVIVLLCAVVTLAQEVQHAGTLTTIDKTRIELQVGDGSKKRIWFQVTPETSVVEKDSTGTFAGAKLKKGASIVVIAPKGESPSSKEWSCTMHTEVSLDGPGKCPVCKMDLIQRDRALLVKEIRLVKR
jgi:hypothetical protein